MIRPWHAVKKLVREWAPVELDGYRHLADRPAAPASGGADWVRVRFGGVATLVVEDRSHRWMTDGFFSRPGLLRLRFGRLRSNRERIDAALRQADAQRLDAVLVAHSHVDHAFDAPYVAAVTGATLYGSTDTRWIAASQHFDLNRYATLTHQPVSVGDFVITPIVGQHSPGDRAPGRITGPVPGQPRARDLKTGTCYSFHVSHPAGTFLIHPSANVNAGAFNDYPSETIYLGVGALGAQDDRFLDTYWNETVRAVVARKVVPLHWDDFTRSLDRPLRGLPRRFDDLERTMRYLECRSHEDHVRLVLPQLWIPTDPFESW